MSKILHIRRRSADCETPLSAYSALRDNHDSFLFESAEGGEHWGRYSIIGFDPACVVNDTGHGLSVRHRDGRLEQLDTDILSWLRQNIVSEEAIAHSDELPFSGGAVGFFSYDMVSRFEPAAKSAKQPAGELASFMLIDRFVVFDNLKGSMDLCVLAESNSNVESILDAIEAQLNAAPRPAPMRLDMPTSSHVTPKAHISQGDYEAMVEKAKEYILAGDIFQVVLSQRFSAPLSCDPLLIYRAVRHINPSPYLFHVTIGKTTLIGSSPEILVRKEGDRAIVRPIAGTRPRGKTEAEDLAFERDLLADDKELAEHVMLVDLGRNDLGRVCDFGSVKLTESMTIERYSHVMHIVSQVEGKLRNDVDALDLLAATFPAGTVSGAPKVRAMQIIDELENEARGPYAGCIGYISFGGGQMDTAIAIRTAVIRGDTIEVQAGAGLVADSVPASEHRECVNKASAMFRAVELAHAQERDA